jgi:fructose-specific phosphotransferase system IIC component
MGANNGIVSDGFSNAGILGVIINGLFLGSYISVIKCLNISHKFYGLYFLLLISIISSSLPVVLLTHGGIALVIFALILQKNTTKFDLP